MLEYEYPMSARRYWRLTLVAAVAGLVWLLVYCIALMWSPSSWGLAARFAGNVVDRIESVVPGVSVSENAALFFFATSCVTIYTLTVFPLCFLQRRRLGLRFEVTHSELVVVSGRRRSGIRLRDIRQVRTGLLGTTFESHWEAICIPSGIFQMRKLLQRTRKLIRAKGGRFEEGAYRRALDKAAFAEWTGENAGRMVITGIVLAAFLGGTGIVWGGIFWPRGYPLLVGGAAIFLMPIYIAGPWIVARTFFRNTHRVGWQPVGTRTANWTVFFSASATWGVYEALIILVFL